MSEAIAFAVGYLIGSAPTANGLARLKGIDMRSAGSGNPGTNNARKLGGYGLAAAILLVEFAKGSAASGFGWVIGDDLTAVVAGIGAITGNVYNFWYRLHGGKGLAIGGGVLIMLWPPGFVLAVVSIAAMAAVTKSSGKAAAAALIALIAVGFGWWALAIENWWGIRSLYLLPWLAISMAIAIVPKHLRDIRSPVTPPDRQLR
ncbi:MAG: glycerol-3-phosphate acyltransferase [Acidimicrobiia bacterium]|nr:glycerol-3-phosphate acyltransferase [Acidimicrobiia bacterium]